MSKSRARLDALRAMAEQDESPHERDIARDKLALFEASEPIEHVTYEQQQRRLAEAARASDEKERERLLKRWERGGFQGITVRAGATTSVTFKR